jgi:hypothetical protein
MDAVQQFRDLIDLGMTVEQAGEVIRLQLIREVSPEQRLEMTRLLMSPNGREVVLLL